MPKSPFVSNLYCVASFGRFGHFAQIFLSPTPIFCSAHRADGSGEAWISRQASAYTGLPEFERGCDKNVGRSPRTAPDALVLLRPADSGFSMGSTKPDQGSGSGRGAPAPPGIRGLLGHITHAVAPDRKSP